MRHLTRRRPPCVPDRVSEEIRSIGFIGAGRLAAALAAALRDAGYPVRIVASRDQASATAFGSRLSMQAAAADAVVEACDLVFLTVPDSHIAALAGSLPWRPGHSVVHCSGALGLDVLAAAAERGAMPGCLHPLQSFPSRTPEPARLHGIFCGVEAPEPLGAYLEALATAVGSHSFRLEDVDRRLYHAAAVFMSNDVVALASAATRLWHLAGLPQTLGREALSPLLLSAARNVAALPFREALTGPVARGDVATIEGHLRALEAAPDLRELYRRLAAELLNLDLGHSEEVSRRLDDILKTN